MFDIADIRDELNELPFKDGKREVFDGRVSEVFEAESEETIAEHLGQFEQELRNHTLKLTSHEGDRDLLDDAKIGTLVGSTISAMLGCALLLMSMPKRPEATFGVQKRQTGGEQVPGPHLSEENEQTQSEDRWRDDGGQGGFNKE